MSKEQMHLEENTLRFSYIGREWAILRADMEELWEKMVQNTSEPKVSEPKVSEKNTSEQIIDVQAMGDKDERLPYWAELWPSSLALAQWLGINQKNINQKSCMDLGCGLGFTALCGAYLGAFVIGADYEADAIVLAKENALANDFKVLDFSDGFDFTLDAYLEKGLLQNAQAMREKNFVDTVNPADFVDKEECFGIMDFADKEKCFGIMDFADKKECFDTVNFVDFRVMDWRRPSIPEHSLDFIWAADIVYERAFVKPILDFLEYALKKKGKAWIAEPSRTIFEHFPEMLKDTSLEIKHVYFQETEALSAHIPSARVNIWEITRS